MTGAAARGTAPGAATHCAFGVARAGPPDLVLMGDSEAEAWEAGVADFALAHGLKGQLVNIPACPPVIGVDERDPFGKPAPCAGHNAAVLDQIVADHRIRVLVLAARWALYDPGPDAAHPNAYLVGPDGRRDPARFHALLTAGLNQALARIETTRAKDLTILILRPTPEFPINPARCAARAAMVGREPGPCLQSPAPPILAHQADAEAVLRAAAAPYPNIRLLGVDTQLCGDGLCRAQLDGRMMFRDGAHLTATGARLLGPGVFAGVGP